jgi:transposase
MNTRCSVCLDPQRREIEAAHVAGVSFREIGKRFGRSKTTIQKHVKLHVPAAAQKALDAANDREIQAGDAILDEVNRLKDDAKRLQAKAEKDHDIRAALIAIDKLTRLAELQARLMGELRDREINFDFINIDPVTAERMAQMFLARRRPAVIVAASPAEAVDVNS